LVIQRVSQRFVPHRLIVSLASFYAGFLFGWFVVVFVRDSFLVFRVLFLPMLGAVNDDDKIKFWYEKYVRDFFVDSAEFDDWVRRFRADFMPEPSGRIRFSDVVERERGRKESRRRRGQTLFRDLRLVGRGEQTRESCGRFLRLWHGCIQHDPAYLIPIFDFCDRPSCSKCFMWGWCAVTAFKVSLRLKVASLKFGLEPEHMTVSLPDSKYDITLARAKVEVQKIAYGFGVIGGYMIPHHQRIDRESLVERYSPHMHLLSFFEGDLKRCRECQFNPDVLHEWVGECRACNGVFSCIRHANEGATRDSGRFFVKVFGERESVPKTLFYQLSHSSYDPSRPKARVGVYFGKLGYSNLGLKVEKPKRLCGVCGGEMGLVKHVGHKPISVISRWRRDFKKQFFQELREGGEMAWEMLDMQEKQFWKERDEYG